MDYDFLSLDCPSPLIVPFSPHHSASIRSEFAPVVCDLPKQMGEASEHALFRTSSLGLFVLPSMRGEVRGVTLV